jgi:hypothetical protein
MRLKLRKTVSQNPPILEQKSICENNGYKLISFETKRAIIPSAVECEKEGGIAKTGSFSSLNICGDKVRSVI